MAFCLRNIKCALWKWKCGIKNGCGCCCNLRKDLFANHHSMLNDPFRFVAEQFYISWSCLQFPQSDHCSLYFQKKQLNETFQGFHLIYSALLIIMANVLVVVCVCEGCTTITTTTTTNISSRSSWCGTPHRMCRKCFCNSFRFQDVTRNSVFYWGKSVRLTFVKYVDLLLLSMWFAFKAVTKLGRRKKYQPINVQWQSLNFHESSMRKHIGVCVWTLYVLYVRFIMEFLQPNKNNSKHIESSNFMR